MIQTIILRSCRIERFRIAGLRASFSRFEFVNRFALALEIEIEIEIEMCTHSDLNLQYRYRRYRYPGAPQKFCATVQLIHIRTSTHGQNIFASLFFLQIGSKPNLYVQYSKIEIYLEVQQGRAYKSPDLKKSYLYGIYPKLGPTGIILLLLLISNS